MTLRAQPLAWCMALSGLLHAAFLALLQFAPPAGPLPDLAPLRVRFVEPPAGPLVDQPPPPRPEPAPAGARAIARSSSRARAPGPGSGPAGSAESRGTPRLPTSPIPVLPEPGPAPRALESRRAPEPSTPPTPPVPLAPPEAAAPPVTAGRPEVAAPPAPRRPAQAPAPPSSVPPSAPGRSLREQLAQLGRRALLTPVPGPYDAGREGEGSGREATVTLESRAHEYAAYLEQVQRRIEQEWRYPLLAQERGLTGKLVIEFAIRQDGRLGRLRLADSSGISILDDAALQAVRRAAPYAALPEAMGLDRLNIVASFEYLGSAVRPRGGS